MMKTETKMTKQMRKIRDQVSAEITDMSLKEEKKYLNRQLQKLKSGRIGTAILNR